MRKMYPIFLFGLLIFSALTSCEKENVELQLDREKVVMRKIGHSILLHAQDSTSLVRPIIHEGNKYRIQFDSSFSFLPDDLVKIIDTIINSALPQSNYLVQITHCKTKQVVYSYEIDHFSSPLPAVIACSARAQPEACYEVSIELISTEPENSSPLSPYLLLTLPLLLFAWMRYVKIKRSKKKEKIALGAYLFDPKKMTLTLVNSTIELTSKESALLMLLYESVNETVEKEIILNKVWGDEGDYVGRTLDVYISKLRKKLENDTSVQLKNSRGIGYKLIIEN